MARVHAEANATVNAPPGVVYALLADYKNGHPKILPPENFRDLVIEQGGTGEGTVFRVNLAAGGRVRSYRMEVSEPEKGHVLKERDLASSLMTAFIVSPQAGGSQSSVRITTDWDGGSGIGGFFEKTFAPMALKRIYTKELQNLAEVVQAEA